MVAGLRALDTALAEPKVTRQGLRRRMLAALAAIAARGPETIPPRSQGGRRLSPADERHPRMSTRKCS